jgi:catechol 2,3-dioxygenase-like lactoylglutathione lyase family enzyme
MINAFDHIHIYASEPEQTMAFYARQFGAERLGALPASDGSANHLLILGGQHMVVASFPQDVSPTDAPGDGATGTRSGYGVGHLGFNVDNLDGLVAKLSAAGVRVHGAPTRSGPLRYVYCDAPDGVTIELTEYVLPPKLAVAATLLRTFNQGVHLAKKAITKGILASMG